MDFTLELAVVIGLNPLYPVHLQTFALQFFRAPHPQIETEDGAADSLFVDVEAILSLIALIIFLCLSHVLHEAQVAATVLEYGD